MPRVEENIMKFKKCKDCGKSGKNIYISNNSLCLDCMLKRVAANAKQMHEKKGASWKKYKLGLKAYANRL